MVKGTKVAWHPYPWAPCTACTPLPNGHVAMHAMPCIHSSLHRTQKHRLSFLAETCMSAQARSFCIRGLELNALMRICEKMEHIFKPDGPQCGRPLNLDYKDTFDVRFFFSYHRQNKHKMRVVSAPGDVYASTLHTSNSIVFPLLTVTLAANIMHRALRVHDN
jgi:hypothetical protein